jgi:hypothetical protein
MEAHPRGVVAKIAAAHTVLCSTDISSGIPRLIWTRNSAELKNNCDKIPTLAKLQNLQGDHLRSLN